MNAWVERQKISRTPSWRAWASAYWTSLAPMPWFSKRGSTQTQGSFLSEPVYFQSKDQQGNIFYTTENTVKTENAPGSKKTAIKGWRERSRRP